MTKETLEALQNVTSQINELWREAEPGARRRALGEALGIVDQEILKRLRPENLNG